MNNIRTIKKVASKNDVRVSSRREQGKRVIGLHGFKANIEAVAREISGYWIEWADGGAYLYSERSSWN